MTNKIGNKIIRLKEVDSTNTYLKKNSDLLKHNGLVVITEMQTSGRGRLGRKFVSLPEKNVTFSVVLHPNLPFEKVQLYSLLAGIVVSRVLENYIDEVKLKWPNDVLVRGKKICGILIETVKNSNQNSPYLILGIGLNTKGFLKDYPMELQDVITTLEEEARFNLKGNRKFIGVPNIENEVIFQELLEELDICIKIFMEDIFSKNIIKNNNFNHKPLLNEWLTRSKVLGTKVRSLNNRENISKKSQTIGTIIGLTKEGYVQIKKRNGDIITHISGEITEIKEN